MRRKKESVLSFAASDKGLPKIVRDYRARYRAISQVLERNPEILSAVHEDLQRLSQGGRGGRKGDYTSENILRALVVQATEGLTFREAVIRIGSDGFLQDFLGMRKKAVMDYSFLDKCFLAIRPETWKRVNELLGQYGVREKLVDPRVIRTDTTVVESNIHYPTDASLLWDTWRVASRLLARGREILIFEPHTELIRRGKRQKPVEFGHKVLLCQTADKFITDYEVYEKQEADCALTEPVIRRHEERFGTRPEIVAADKGFCPAASKREELAELVGMLAIPRRLQDFLDKALAFWQGFRAGIEGTISVLKRVFRLFRCYFRGFKGFTRSVGLGVFCHNLIVLAEEHSG